MNRMERADFDGGRPRRPQPAARHGRHSSRRAQLPRPVFADEAGLRRGADDTQADSRAKQRSREPPTDGHLERPAVARSAQDHFLLNPASISNESSLRPSPSLEADAHCAACEATVHRVAQRGIIWNSRALNGAAAASRSDGRYLRMDSIVFIHAAFSRRRRRFSLPRFHGHSQYA